MKKPARTAKDLRRIEVVQRIVQSLQPSLITDEVQWVIDYNEIADRWLALIHPLWAEELAKPHHRPLRLRDLRSRLVGDRIIPTTTLAQIFSDPLPTIPPLSERVVAAIIGVPSM